MDADGLILACATTAEARAGRRAGLRVALIGLAGVNGVPSEPLVSFGLAGALDGLPTGAVIDAVLVVDEEGRTLWSGPGLGVPGAIHGTIVASARVVDDPAERSRLRGVTAADAVDLESGVLAGSGQLQGVLRAISDTPERTLHGICNAVRPEGRYNWLGTARAFGRDPAGFVAAASDGVRALRALTEAAKRWRSG